MWYLCLFVHRHLEFRLPEVESLAKLYGCQDVEWQKLPGDHTDSPFWLVKLPSEEIARKIGERAILVKGLFEVWGYGPNYEELEAAVKAYPEDRKVLYLKEDSSFKLVVEGLGKAFSMEEQKEVIERFAFIPFEGRVDLKKAEHVFWVIESIGEHNNNGLPALGPKRFFFTRQVGCGDRTVLKKYDLKSRKYIGPTSMDAEISLLIAQQALACKGALVFDPFVGTGSLLVAAAHYGAATMGADIDIRVVRDGKGPDRNVWVNFEQYGLPPPLLLLRADNHRPPWREDLREVIDAVVADPPYGVRAGGRKSGGRKLLDGRADPYTVPEHLRENHIPSTAPYTLEECLHDLFDVSARLLKVGGRLVYFFPSSRGDGAKLELPTHPCFRLIANSEQILTLRWGRRLLTMEKVCTYTPAMAAESEATREAFKTNHVVLVEEMRTKGLDIRSQVMAPLENYLQSDSKTGDQEQESEDGNGTRDSLEHMVRRADRKKEKFESRPCYRAKNV